MAQPVSAQIRWAANVDELKANLQQGIGVVDAMKASVDRTVQSLSGNGLLQAANKTAAAILQMGDGMNVATGALKLTSGEQDRVNTLMEKALAKYEALGLQAPPAIRELADATKQAGEETEKSTGFLDGFVSKYIEARLTWEAAREALRTLVDFVKGSIDAYAQAETAQRRLTVALQTQGLAIPGLNQQYLELARRYQETTTYSHTAIEGAEALFVQLGNVGPDMMDRALKAATDLSSGLGMDLNSAVQLLSRAAEGQTQTFSRYGIVLDQSRVKAEGFGYVLDAVEAKVGGQAQAELDTYAGKMKQLGNEWEDVKEKIGGAIVQNPVVEASLIAIANAVDHLSHSTTEGLPSVEKFIDLVNGNSSTSTFTALAAGFVGATEEENKMVAVFRQAQQEYDAAIAKQKQALADLDQGKTPITKVPQDLIDAWKQADEADKAAAKAFQNAVRSMADAISGADVAKRVKELNAALTELGGVSKLTQPELNRLTKEAADLLKQGAQLPPTIIQAAHAFDALRVPVKDGIDNLKGFGERVSALLVTDTQLETAIGSLDSKVRVGVSGLGELGFKVTSGFGEAVKGFEAQQKAADAAARQTEHDIQELARSFDELGSAIGGDIGHIISDFGHMIGAIEQASKAFEAMRAAERSGDLLGTISSAVGGITALASAAMAAGSAIKGLWDHFFGTAGRDAVTQFATSMGGFDVLHEKLDQLGQDGETLWKNLTQGVGRNNPQQAQQAIDAINNALKGQDDYLSRLPDEMQKYGLTWAQAGQQAEQSHLDDIAKGLIQDFADLTKAGFDVTTVTQAMSTSVNDYIHEALRTGTEVPDAMKPLLQKMIDLGTLTDANGNAITSLDSSGISFSETMTEGFKSIVDAVNQLTEALTGVPYAIRQIPTHVDIDFTARKTGDWPDAGSGGSVAGAATGGLVGYGNVIPFPTEYRAMGGPIGTDTVHVMATPGEIILNAAQQGRVAGALSGGRADALLEEVRDLLRQHLPMAAGGEGDTYVYIDGQRQDAKTVRKVRQLAARGGLRTRATTGRSY